MKTCLITGGARGIGRAITNIMLQNGYRVLATYCNEVDSSFDGFTLDFESDKGKGNLILKDVDFSDKESFDRFIDFLDDFGEIDCLINNAAVCYFSDFLDISYEILERTMAINLYAPFLLTQKVGGLMIEKKIKGSIIFITSISAEYGGSQQAHYCCSKGALELLMKSVAISLGEFGIRSNSIQPGTIITDINKAQLENNPELEEYFINRSTLKCLPQPEDIAKVVLFLASNNALNISGQSIRVDSGLTCNLQ